MDLRFEVLWHADPWFREAVARDPVRALCESLGLEWPRGVKLLVHEVLERERAVVVRGAKVSPRVLPNCSETRRGALLGMSVVEEGESGVAPAPSGCVFPDGGAQAPMPVQRLYDTSDVGHVVIEPDPLSGERLFDLFGHEIVRGSRLSFLASRTPDERSLFVWARPALVPGVRWSRVLADSRQSRACVLIESGRGAVLAYGAGYERALRLVEAGLVGRWSPPRERGELALRIAVARLAAHGVLQAEVASRAFSALPAAWGVSASAQAALVGHASVWIGVCRGAAGEVLAGALARALARFGVVRTESPEAAALCVSVACTVSGLRALAPDAVRAHLLVLSVFGGRIVGFVDGAFGPCVGCFEGALRAGPFGTFLRAAEDRSCDAEVAQELADSEVAALARRAAQALARVWPGGTVWSTFPERGETQGRLAPDPRCAHCRTPVADAASWGRFDASWRDPHRLLRMLHQHVDPAIGTVASVRPVYYRLDPLAESVHVAFGFSGVRHVDYPTPAWQAGVWTGGKGRSPVAAELGALMEAVEAHCVAWRGDEPVRVASAASLEAEGVLSPAVLSAFSQDQRALVAESGRSTVDAYRPSSLTVEWCGAAREAPVAWVEVWTLPGRERRLVPRSAVYVGAPPDFSDREGIDGYLALARYAGVSAGVTWRDAVVRALLELYERDAVGLWWATMPGLAAVELEALGDAWVSELSRRCAVVGRTLRVLDVSVVAGFPVAVAVSRLETPCDGSHEYALGMACRLDFREAVRVAVAEMVMRLETVPDRTVPVSTRRSPEMREAWRALCPKRAQWLEGGGPVSVSPGWAQQSPQARDEVARLDRLVAGVRAQGLSVAVVELTRGRFRIPVFRAFVPGLADPTPCYANPRLRSAVVHAGWFDVAPGDSELNPLILPIG